MIHPIVNRNMPVVIHERFRLSEVTYNFSGLRVFSTTTNVKYKCASVLGLCNRVHSKLKLCNSKFFNSVYSGSPVSVFCVPHVSSVTKFMNGLGHEEKP